MLNPANLSFRSLQTEDLPLMHQWLNTDFVKQWWDGLPRSFESVRAEFEPGIAGTDAYKPFLIMYATTPIGYIQYYNLRDEPEYAAAINLPQEATGVDIFIGHPDYIHQGLGSFAIKKFIQEYVFSQPDVEICIIDPDPENKVAIRAYEKAGFVYWKTLRYADGDKPEEDYYMMRQTKAEFLAS